MVGFNGVKPVKVENGFAGGAAESVATLFDELADVPVKVNAPKGALVFVASKLPRDLYYI